MTLYRKILLARLHRILSKTKLFLGGSIPYQNSDIKLSTQNPSVHLDDFISSFHKLTEHTSAKDPLPLDSGGYFIGCIRSEYSDTAKDDLMVVERKVTGLVTLAFRDEKGFFLVPGIFCYFNDIPRLLVIGNAARTGTFIDDTLNMEDILVVDVMGISPLENIYNFAKSALTPQDRTMGDVLIKLSEGRYIEKEPADNTINAMRMMGMNPELVRLVDKFLYTPVLKLQSEGVISEVFVQDGVNMKLIPYVEFMAKDKPLIVLKQSNLSPMITDLDSDTYSIAGKNFYIDDTEWVENDKGGITTKYRVVQEKEAFKESVSEGIIINTYDIISTYGEGALGKAKDYLVKKYQDLTKTMKRNKNDRKMYKLFSKEIMDGHSKLLNSATAILSSTGGAIAAGALLGGYGSLRDTLRNPPIDPEDGQPLLEEPINLPAVSPTIQSFITLGFSVIAATITYLSLRKTQETKQGIETVKDYYMNEADIAEEERKEALDGGNVKKAKKLALRRSFCIGMLDRIKREEERRENKANGIE